MSWLTDKGELDLTEADHNEFYRKLGKLMMGCLHESGFVGLFLQPSGDITLAPKSFIEETSDEDIVNALIDVWDEDDIVTYLEALRSSDEVAEKVEE